MQHFGSRAQVMHGNAKQTGGGLKKKDLKYNKHGKIVSKKMSMIAKNKMIGGAFAITNTNITNINDYLYRLASEIVLKKKR